MAYADDVAFVCYDQRKLEQSIAIVDRWCQRMKMQLNKKKSGILAIRADRRTKSIRQKSFDSIPVLESYTYLGMRVSDNGRFSNHVT